MAIVPWARRMQTEVELLPDTLSALRESATHIKQVSEDLTEVAATLRRITTALDSAGLVEATDVITRSGEAMRATASTMAAAQESFSEVNHALVDGIAKLSGGDLFNPFRKR